MNPEIAGLDVVESEFTVLFLDSNRHRFVSRVETAQLRIVVREIVRRFVVEAVMMRHLHPYEKSIKTQQVEIHDPLWVLSHRSENANIGKAKNVTN